VPHTVGRRAGRRGRGQWGQAVSKDVPVPFEVARLDGPEVAHVNEPDARFCGEPHLNKPSAYVAVRREHTTLS
jgi:hypothetical protein